jgi:hypothetical protein
MNNFRFWCREKWYEHLDELQTHGYKTVPYSQRQYFQLHKWWLKREFQHQQKNNLL